MFMLNIITINRIKFPSYYTNCINIDYLHYKTNDAIAYVKYLYVTKNCAFIHVTVSLILLLPFLIRFLLHNWVGGG